MSSTCKHGCDCYQRNNMKNIKELKRRNKRMKAAAFILYCTYVVLDVYLWDTTRLPLAS
jgi:hypothetical protein